LYNVHTPTSVRDSLSVVCNGCSNAFPSGKCSFFVSVQVIGEWSCQPSQSHEERIARSKMLLHTLPATMDYVRGLGGTLHYDFKYSTTCQDQVCNVLPMANKSFLQSATTMNHARLRGTQRFTSAVDFLGLLQRCRAIRCIRTRAGARLRQCFGCMHAQYCSHTCQRHAWIHPDHEHPHWEICHINHTPVCMRDSAEVSLMWSRSNIICKGDIVVEYFHKPFEDELKVQSAFLTVQP
jgi:hypothetical protein